MKVFITGASGHIGSVIVSQLIKQGHQVIGLVRSEASFEKVKSLGAEPLMGELTDLEILKIGATEADGVIHTAFIHDFSKFQENAQIDKAAIEAMGSVLEGTDKPIVITSGILGIAKKGEFVTESDACDPASPRFSEKTALELAAKGIKASIIRLPPSVHDKGDKGFVPFIIHQSIQNGKAAYPNEGTNRWPAVNRQDAANLFILALEKGAVRAIYHAIGDEGIPLKEIAKVISDEKKLPLASVTGDALSQHFQWMAMFIQFDSPAKADITKAELGWTPTHIGLLEDMREHYF
ncbi:SDR family oxidoreductase [Rhizosphaericola mali]|uniref:SDR family oxidoreductase n=1 Tax=Rhizosphaericola mali TaxID=2545455 RepID=A0A5P2FZ23_9BACT|nr:SDR family oxidoreductase [Rhizosphaericola mali]QES88455.1 SDR family oxidoreductase [Rhizosphaericola mali]